MHILIIILWWFGSFSVVQVPGQDSVFSGLFENSSQYHYAHDSISLAAAADTLSIAVPVDALNTADTSDLNRIDRLKNNKVVQLITTGKVIGTIFILVVAWFLIKLVIQILRLISERRAKYRITVKGLIPLVRISGWVGVIIFIVAGIIQPSIATLVAFSASIGVAVGFASQDILKNIFGGIVIIFDQPFKVGDKIEVGNYYGEVVEIGLRSTRLVTPDDSLVSVPNAEIMNQSVSNANAGEPNCQVVAEIFLPINVNTHQVRKLALEAAQVSKFVYLKKPIVVLFFHELKEKKTYLKMRLKAYVLDIRYEFVFKSEMTEQVLKVLLEQGIIPESY